MKCTKCGTEKDLGSFRPHKGYKSGRSSQCNTCYDNYTKQYYLKNKQKIIQRSKLSNIKTKEKMRSYVLDYLSKNPCFSCGESDIVVLEFDHLDDKKYNVAELLRDGSFRKLKAEISKCQVLCANCHRRKTAKDFNWYKTF